MQKISQDINIGHRLRTLRKSKHLTQEQVVAIMRVHGIEITRGRYSRIETGELSIRVSEIRLLRELYTCTYEDIID